MGSLNDLNLKDPHTGLLLDAVFRDMKLFYGGPEDRIQWSKLEELYKGDLPPRIKNAFGP